MEIKAIETEYNGYKFRSRLEARWAVFFDALGLDYEYEPEGFELENGIKYLPDFKVKCYGTRGCLSGDTLFPCEGCKHHITSSCDVASVENFCDLFNYIELYNNNLPLPWWITLRRPPERTEIVKCKKCEPRFFDLYIEVKGEMTKSDAEKIKAFSKHYPVLIVGNIPQKGCSYDSQRLGAYEKMSGFDIYPFNYKTIDGDYFGAYPAGHDGKFYLWGDDCNYIWSVEEVENAYSKARQARFEYGEKPEVKK